MSSLCAALIIVIILSIPVQLIILIIRGIKRKSIKKHLICLAICVTSVIPLTLIGAFTDPATRCKHDREIISETPATCTEKGKIVGYCSVCDVNVTSYKPKIPHNYLLVETIDATCTQEGYTLEKCETCSSTRKTNPSEALGHNMKEVSHIEPTSSSEGKIISRCEQCGKEETSVLSKLADTPIKSDESVIDKTPADAPLVEQNDWKNIFSSKGFTEDEIGEYEEIFTNVGITDYHDVEVIENGIMHMVRGKIYDSNVLQLNVILENRKIIVVTLAGIPDYDTKAYINWRGKLKFKKEQSKKSIDLYYDVDGGYIAKLDWENMLLTPYDEELEQ